MSDDPTVDDAAAPGDDDLSHAAPPRLYPTARPYSPPPVVPIDTGYTDWLAAGGFPDHAESAAAFAAGQRAAVRAGENRRVLTTGAPGPGAISPTPPVTRGVDPT